MSVHPPLFEARGVTKRFPGTLALSEVDLEVFPGEVVAVIGENGAGKSTLMKILAGIFQPDEGTVVAHGKPARFATVRDATACGIVLIHQELSLLPNLSVAANLFLGREHRWVGILRHRAMRSAASRALAQVGLGIDADTPVAALPMGQRQLVEVAKALSHEASLLIMDEPTSSLSETEAEVLFNVIDELRARGVAVLYVSHRLKEVARIADRVVVLRDGHKVSTLEGRQIRRAAMVRHMIGRDVARLYERTSIEKGPVALQADAVRTGHPPGSDVSLEICQGEIVGVFGLVSSGRSALLRSLFGVNRSSTGTVSVMGEALAPGSPSHAVAAGVAYVPEDRAHQGLVLELPAAPNITLGALHRNAAGWGLLDVTWERVAARDMIERLRIAGAQTGKRAGLLSGGNQQKTVLGKWLLLDPAVLLLNEPTRGIDVGAKQEIYRTMEELAARGLAILFASSEMDEIIALADRTLVMHDGSVAGELSGEHMTEEALMQLATGQIMHNRTRART